MFKRSSRIRRGKLSPARSVPDHIERPYYAESGGGEPGRLKKQILKPDEIQQMRRACRAARRVLDRAIEYVSPGVTTDSIDSLVHNACIEEGGYPSPLNYHGFPKSVCTSVNEVICHGIPDDRPLQEGDIVNVDVTVYLNGFHGDCSETVAVGDVDRKSVKLMEVTREAMMRGIETVKDGSPVRNIGRAIESYVTEYGFSVVHEYCGHGIGRHFHCGPTVPHFFNPNEGSRVKKGMTFTVEPMINMGSRHLHTWKDGWTVVTNDFSRSAQYEHTVLVTDDGAEILTLPETI